MKKNSGGGVPRVAYSTLIGWSVPGAFRDLTFPYHHSTRVLHSLSSLLATGPKCLHPIPLLYYYYPSQRRAGRRSPPPFPDKNCNSRIFFPPSQTLPKRCLSAFPRHARSAAGHPSLSASAFDPVFIFNSTSSPETIPAHSTFPSGPLPSTSSLSLELQLDSHSSLRQCASLPAFEPLHFIISFDSN